MYLTESKNNPEEDQINENDIRGTLIIDNTAFNGHGLDPITGKSIKPLALFTSNEKYERFMEKMLSKEIQNEAYIQGSAAEWKSVLLNWTNHKFKQITWRVSVQLLMDELKKSGIIFNEDESLVSPLIIQWLEAFEDAVKKELKLTMNMIVIE